MTVPKIVYLFFLVFSFSGCHGERIGFFIIDEKILDSIPSGSGLVVREKVAFIISDDGTGVYRFDLQNDQQYKIAITGMPYQQYRESKSVKHDFEAACLVQREGNSYLMALGSGSSAARDSLLLLNISSYNDQKMISLRSFYKQLQILTGTDNTHWNIEGITVAGGEIMMLNRGNNLVIKTKLDEFFSYLLEGAAFPKFKFEKMQLPSIDEHQAKLSGACTLDEEHLLICASVEDTPDWISDGPVLGSYVGIYSLRKKKLTGSYLLKDRKGNPLLQKIESVEILERTSAGDIFFVAIADNDDGTSKLFWLKLEKQ